MKALLHKKFGEHLSEIIHGTSIAFIFRVLGALLAMAFQVVLTRQLGAVDAGRYVLGVSCVLFISVLGRLGLDTILVRTIASHAAVNEWRSVKSARKNAFAMVMPASFLLSVLLFFAAEPIGIYLFKDAGLVLPLRLMAWAAPFWSLAAHQSEILRGFKKVGQYLFIQSVSMPAVTLLTALIWGRTHGLVWQAFFYVLAAAMTAGIALFFWKNHPKQQENGQGEVVRPSQLLHSSLPMLWVAAVQYINIWISTVILGSHGNPAEVAVFNAANRLALAPAFLLISVNSIMGPKLAALHKTGSREDLQRVAAQTTRILFFAVLPLFILFFLFPSPILGIFGEDFKEADSILRILTAGQMTLFMTGFAGQLLLMTGHERDLRNLSTGIAVMNVLLSWFLIARFGMAGAAWAASGTAALNSAITAYFVWRRLRIQAHLFSRRSHGSE